MFWKDLSVIYGFLIDFIGDFGLFWIGLESEMVRLAGLEPVTPTMSRWCSNQLSYSRILKCEAII